MWGFKFSQYAEFLNKNERNKVYLRKNGSEGRQLADSKLKTKRVLDKAGVGVPKLIKRFRNTEDIDNFKWEDLEGNFVIKPVTGYGGEGIVVIKKRGKWAGEWLKMDGETLTTTDLKMHCREILGGKYSLHGMSDMVLLEERIKIHPLFYALTKSGTPDIRVIIYNKVPVMAMFRVPTEKSKGKANLQQGAIGLGIDLATGITTFGIEGKGEELKRIYDFNKKKRIKVNGIKIPFWREILETSIKCQEAIPSLGFMGVDVVLDKEKGPMVLEVNARPGLSIQICNKAGLKKRMNQIADIEVRSVNHAITLAKYLFGESFFEKVEEKEKMKVLKPLETVKIKYGKGKKERVEVLAKVDTGAFRSSIDRDLAMKYDLLREDRVIYYRHYRNSMGSGVRRPVIELTFWIQGKKITSAINVADRKKMRAKFLVGRRDLHDFMVKT
jgi:alpha-L-glutamate ligase-like protein